MYKLLHFLCSLDCKSPTGMLRETVQKGWMDGTKSCGPSVRAAAQRPQGNPLALQGLGPAQAWGGASQVTGAC